MKKITEGYFIPLYGVLKKNTNVATNLQKPEQIFVEDFFLDIYPVRNIDYLKFVRENPSWKKSNVVRLFANSNYLFDWQKDTTLSTNLDPYSPVTMISWYAAKAYCECQGKRLPTTEEWEYVARASETKRDARKEKDFNQKIITSYETPKAYNQKVGSTFKNYWGIYDLHGLVWEWTYDFNSVLITGESRKDVDTDRKLFCAGGAVGTSDLMNYAAYMRYAFRGSLKANYVIRNLGFRCAKSIDE